MATFYMEKDRAGEWRWVLVAANNRYIATSGEGYSNRNDCIEGIKLVKRDAPAAPVKDRSSGTPVTVPGV